MINLIQKIHIFWDDAISISKWQPTGSVGV